MPKQVLRFLSKRRAFANVKSLTVPRIMQERMVIALTRLLTVSSIMVLIVGLMFGATFYAKDTKNSLEVHIKAATQACAKEDKEGLVNASNAMSELLKKRHGVLSLYVRHDETEKLETHNVILASYAKLGEFDNASVCLAEISFVANHIYQRETLSIDNIF